jgi:hypothetical protein
VPAAKTHRAVIKSTVSSTPAFPCNEIKQTTLSRNQQTCDACWHTADRPIIQKRSYHDTWPAARQPMGAVRQSTSALSKNW